MTKDDLINLLKKYTPSFIINNAVSNAIYDGIASSLLTIYNAIVALVDANWTGKGLLKNATQNQIIFRDDDSEATIRTRLTDRFTRHPLVGSEDQILPDVRNLTGDQTATATYFDSSNCGLIVDVTYIGVDDQAIIDVNKLVRFNLTKSELGYEHIEFAKPTIREKFVPIDVEIIYNIIEA